MNKLRWWFVHLAIFVVGQVVLLAAGESWPAAFLAGEVPDTLTLLSSPAMWVSRMWCIVFAVDTAWSWSYVTFRKGEKR
jgi:DHA1 family multidrug resistance protein-like MFS transporter